MGNWNDILNEIDSEGSTHDIVRKRYLHKLHSHTGRNVIAYYSGWLQKPDSPGLIVNDADKNGFMAVINKLDKPKGLDLILHTPGGETAATESIVDYLRSVFGQNIRVIVPQLAMSAGTMIACSAQEIIMGKHSSLGPIDPQFHGVPAHGIVEEFQRAYLEIKADNTKLAVWRPILEKYAPTFIGECEKAIKWSEQMVREWLATGMFAGDAQASTKIDTIISELGDHALNKSHSRHLSAKKCRDIGLKVVDLEADQRLQDAVMSVHHTFIHTLSSTPASKVIQNQKGTAYVQIAGRLVQP